MHTMEILYIATGFTGGLTIVWLVRVVVSLFVWRPVSLPHFGPGTLDRVLRELSSARREVLLCTDSLNCPVIAQSLVEARARKVQVEILLGKTAETHPESCLPFLLNNGLSPLIEDQADSISGNLLVIDGRAVVIVSGPLHPDQEQRAAAVYALVCRSMPDVIGPFREQLLAGRTRARAARRTLGPASVAARPTVPTAPLSAPPVVSSPPVVSAPVVSAPLPVKATPIVSVPSPASVPLPTKPPVVPSMTAPPVVASVPFMPSYTATAPVSSPMAGADFPCYTTPEDDEEAQILPPATPSVASLLSRPLATFRQPEEAEESPRPPQPPSLSDDDDENFADDHSSMHLPSGAPPVTLAAAELFARLRREVASRSEEPVVSGGRPPSVAN